MEDANMPRISSMKLSLSLQYCAEILSHPSFLYMLLIESSYVLVYIYFFYVVSRNSSPDSLQTPIEKKTPWRNTISDGLASSKAWISQLLKQCKKGKTKGRRPPNKSLGKSLRSLKNWSWRRPKEVGLPKRVQVALQNSGCVASLEWSLCVIYCVYVYVCTYWGKN